MRGKNRRLESSAASAAAAAAREVASLADMMMEDPVGSSLIWLGLNFESYGGQKVVVFWVVFGCF
jgi:hypothetical protein